jgi:hypothetical protein
VLLVPRVTLDLLDKMGQSVQLGHKVKKETLVILVRPVRQDLLVNKVFRETLVQRGQKAQWVLLVQLAHKVIWAQLDHKDQQGHKVLPVKHLHHWVFLLM